MTEANNDTNNNNGMEQDSAQYRAEKAGAAMYARDRTAHALGIVLEKIAPGCSVMRMTVRGDMVNGHNICHGGMIFTLADTAFAFACNSYNQTTVALKCTIDFLAPAQLGEELVAVAEERTARGRTGVYDVGVSNGAGDLIALFRGNSYRIKGEVITSTGSDR
jgi:acyl-CoA thioesterase